MWQLPARKWTGLVLTVGLLALLPALAQVDRPEPPVSTSASISSTVAAAELVPGSFVDVAARVGINFLHQAPHTSKKYLIETMGSGVALLDYDNDGRLDIFLVNGAHISDPTPKGTVPQKTGPQYWNRLYHQKNDGTFEDVTEKAGLQGVGYGMGVAVGDLR